MEPKPLLDNLSVTTLAYDAGRYPFDRIIKKYLAGADLTRLRAGVAPTTPQDSLYKLMERSAAFGRLYEQLAGPAGERFYGLYRDFVREVVYPLFDEPILYQTRPSHRILFADNPGASRFHRDRDYGHNPREVNFQVAQTPVYATNAMWIERTEGAADYQPAEIGPGRCLVFDGANLAHGARVNTTGRSRVTFDFRVLRVRDAELGLASRLPDTDEEGNPVRFNARNFTLLAPNRSA